MADRPDMPALPETMYQLYYEWPDDEDGYGGSEVVDGDAFTAAQMHAYAIAYADQRVKEEREACAALIEPKRQTPDLTEAEVFRAVAAAAIRSRKDTL